MQCNKFVAGLLLLVLASGAAYGAENKEISPRTNWPVARRPGLRAEQAGGQCPNWCGECLPAQGPAGLQRDFRPEISRRNLLHKLTRDALWKKGLMTATKRQLNLTAR